ncbi:hypothetical protein GCM10007147_30840 [Nocardiopsis kunsanensis]|uniref:Uncharacterized protein n=1 Tax=Nocardiopsis kunsanensis TaxID=141693 RepID=A0A918XG27_9ACTN|nr:hypothetical protein GCM10007147_30840 [Nocardiopsis kunsanensis]
MARSGTIDQSLHVPPQEYEIATQSGQLVTRVTMTGFGQSGDGEERAYSQPGWFRHPQQPLSCLSARKDALSALLSPPVILAQ